MGWGDTTSNPVSNHAEECVLWTARQRHDFCHQIDFPLRSFLWVTKGILAAQLGAPVLGDHRIRRSRSRKTARLNGWCMGSLIKCTSQDACYYVSYCWVAYNLSCGSKSFYSAAPLLAYCSSFWPPMCFVSRSSMSIHLSRTVNVYLCDICHRNAEASDPRVRP